MHYDSMSVENSLVTPGRIVLVDDVVTRGCTLIAAASRIAEAFPSADVRGFALIRYRGRVPDIDTIFDPAVGVIAFDGQGTYRDP